MSDILPYHQSLLIIPTYNEIENIDLMLTSITHLYPELSILIIDDGSPDGTARVVKKFMDNSCKIHLIEREGKQGLASAYIAGFRWAIEREYLFIFQMDCDFSHDPKDIPNLLTGARSHDLIIGSRYIKGGRVINWPAYRLFLSYFAGFFTLIVTGLNISDVTSGYKCLTRSVLQELNFDSFFSKGYSFQIELAYKIMNNNFKVKEVPITFHERSRGKSKMSSKIIYEALINVVRLRLKKISGTL